jgi:hypothetical protein
VQCQLGGDPRQGISYRHHLGPLVLGGRHGRASLPPLVATFAAVPLVHTRRRSRRAGGPHRPLGEAVPRVALHPGHDITARSGYFREITLNDRGRHLLRATG